MDGETVTQLGCIYLSIFNWVRPKNLLLIREDTPIVEEYRIPLIAVRAGLK